MELNYSADELQTWGIEPFDNSYSGLPTRAFNLVRTCSQEISIVAIGHFLQAGIELRQRVVLVGFDHPAHLLSKFNGYGFSFDDALNKEQFIYLYYKPCFSHSLSFSTDYKLLFNEIKTLANGTVERIAFLNSDILFNLETYFLAETSAERITASFADHNCVILGCYQTIENISHQHLDMVGQALLRSYIKIQQQEESNDRCYKLTLQNSPLFEANEPITLHLNPGSGFNPPNIELIRHG
jgi:hypothetical protein